MDIAPRGIGFFLASGDVQNGQTDRTASRVAECGAKWAAIWVDSPDGRRPTMERIASLASALQHFGVSVWVWGLVDSEKPEEAAEWLSACAVGTGATGVILDVEESYKGERDALRRLVKRARETLPKGKSLAVTSYPYGHRTLPWDELQGIGVGMPQLYTSAAIQTRVDKSFAEYGKRHASVVPVIGSYLGDIDRLRLDLRRVCLDKSGQVRVPGVGVWALGTTSTHERRVIAEAARWF